MSYNLSSDRKVITPCKNYVFSNSQTDNKENITSEFEFSENEKLGSLYTFNPFTIEKMTNDKEEIIRLRSTSLIIVEGLHITKITKIVDKSKKVYDSCANSNIHIILIKVMLIINRHTKMKINHA